MGHVGDMTLPDLGFTEVQVAGLNAFVKKKVEETRDEMRDKVEKLERTNRANKERAKAFQNMSIFRVLLMPIEDLAASIYSYFILPKSAHTTRHADESISH